MNGTTSWENAKNYVTDTVADSQPLSASFRAAYATIGTLGIIGNLLCLVVLLGHKPLRRKSSNYFAKNQTFIDLLVSLFLIPTLLVNSDQLEGPLACYVWSPRTIFLGLFTASLFNITALTVERYFKTVHPILHRIWVTKRRLLLIIVVVSASGILLKMPYVLSGVSIASDGTCVIRSFPSPTLSNVVAMYNFLVEFFLPLLIIAFCYIQIARSLRRGIRPVTAATNPGNLALARAGRNCIKTLLYVVLVFMACTAFKHGLILVQSFSNVPLDLAGSTFNVAQILSFAVCCTNPFIYIFHHDEFKVGLRKVVLRKQPQPQPPVGLTIGQGATSPRIDKF